jgi:hypothetical protein
VNQVPTTAGVIAALTVTVFRGNMLSSNRYSSNVYVDIKRE